jgi:hypothetical protein
MRGYPRAKRRYSEIGDSDILEIRLFRGPDTRLGSNRAFYALTVYSHCRAGRHDTDFDNPPLRATIQPWWWHGVIYIGSWPDLRPIASAGQLAG